MRIQRRWLAAMIAAALLGSAGGCGLQNQMLVSTGGVLLEGFDQLALPQSAVTLQARLLGGNDLKGLEGYLVGFYHFDQKIGESRTDDQGNARLSYTAGGPGDDVVLARLEDPDVRKFAAPAVELLIAVRPKDTPILVTDLDDTIVEGNFNDVLASRARPIEGSRDLLGELGKRYTIVYLTHRPQILLQESKQWLRKYDYPLGPLYIGGPTAFFVSSEKAKTEQLKALRPLFPRLEVGIGNEAGDVQAYLANGMKGLLLIHPEEMKKPEDVRRAIRGIKALPEQVDVVHSWAEIGLVFQQKGHFPPSAAVAELGELHDKMIDELLAPPPAAKEGGPR